ncbi:hypothetical protein GCM10011297_28650 [Bacterioplanes sanyensis]|uniref:general secretion pathway protein GspB n=1 Tax=Bacterioplanes sanyensis TaxID=1249553 RepID=UPI00167369D1|nr:general secretion pathway protein GspB [Bacterioplanes sanyensis]GGY54071.1 hypothetical protein GCM10011297_28650 [Bacterioplanes sanyensis]
MSYILEALKKSQQQAEQQSERSPEQTTEAPLAPHLLTQWPQPGSPQRSLWPWLAVTLLVTILVSLLLYRWTLSENVPQVSDDVVPMVSGREAEQRLAPERESPVVVPAQPVVEVSAAPRLVPGTAPESDAVAPELAVQVPTQSVVAAKTEVSPSAPTSVSTSVSSTAPSARTSSARGQVTQRTLPPLSELRKIPDLIITGHIYSTQASARQVTMNGRVWGEGDRIATDVTLTTITHDGIELDVAGWPLTIHRNRGWQSLSD